MAFSFENLEVWQEARRFASALYHVTESFPSSEQFGPTSQLRRAAVSVATNIAEGSSRYSATRSRDFVRFLRMALGSVYETVSGLSIASDRRFIDGDTNRRLYGQAEQLAKRINALINSMEKRPQA